MGKCVLYLQQPPPPRSAARMEEHSYQIENVLVSWRVQGDGTGRRLSAWTITIAIDQESSTLIIIQMPKLPDRTIENSNDLIFKLQF